MADEDLYQAMSGRLHKLNAERLRWQASLAESRADGDEHSIGEALSHLAALNRHEKELRSLADDHVAAINEKEEMSDAEFQAMSPEKMAKHPEAVDRIFRKSKYYTEGQWSDPKVAEAIRRGYVELQRRKGVERGG